MVSLYLISRCPGQGAYPVPGREGDIKIKGRLKNERRKNCKDHRGGFSPLETEKYLSGGRDFIDEDFIQAALLASKSPSRERVMDIIAKSLSVETLTLEETACLLNVSDRDLLDKMERPRYRSKRRYMITGS
jgi:hypothetical protein